VVETYWSLRNGFHNDAALNWKWAPRETRRPGSEKLLTTVDRCARHEEVKLLVSRLLVVNPSWAAQFFD